MKILQNKVLLFLDRFLLNKDKKQRIILSKYLIQRHLLICETSFYSLKAHGLIIRLTHQETLVLQIENKGKIN